MKRSPIRKVSPKRVSRVGNLGIVRLTGFQMRELRLACWLRDKGLCQECGKALAIDSDGGLEAMQLAHIRTKRNNGDTLENVRTLCAACHHREHNPKVVPSKERTS